MFFWPTLFYLFLYAHCFLEITWRFFGPWYCLWTESIESSQKNWISYFCICHFFLSSLNMLTRHPVLHCAAAAILIKPPVKIREFCSPAKELHHQIQVFEFWYWPKKFLIGILVANFIFSDNFDQILQPLFYQVLNHGVRFHIWVSVACKKLKPVFLWVLWKSSKVLLCPFPVSIRILFFASGLFLYDVE